DLECLERGFADHAYFRSFLERFHAALLRLERLPVPTVAAVNGLARAGGFEIALACDLAICADEARIADNHTGFGVIPGAGASQRRAGLACSAPKSSFSQPGGCPAPRLHVWGWSCARCQGPS